MDKLQFLVLIIIINSHLTNWLSVDEPRGLYTKLSPPFQLPKHNKTRNQQHNVFAQHSTNYHDFAGTAIGGYHLGLIVSIHLGTVPTYPCFYTLHCV